MWRSGVLRKLESQTRREEQEEGTAQATNWSLCFCRQARLPGFGEITSCDPDPPQFCGSEARVRVGSGLENAVTPKVSRRCRGLRCGGVTASTGLVPVMAESGAGSPDCVILLGCGTGRCVGWLAGSL